MSEFDSLYREVILDHYKNPRGHGVIEGADAEAEGQNPLCGDEVSIFVAFGADGDTIDDVKFRGRGCAISQAATSMLTEMVKGRKASDVATMPRDELLDEVGIPLTPVRLKCALLGLGVPATTRASFYLYSLAEEIDRLVEGLHKVRRTFA